MNNLKAGLMRTNCLCWKQFVIVILCIVFVSFHLLYKIGNQFGTLYTVDRGDDIILFDDITEAEILPTPDRPIFFIETSCVRNGLAALNARQACAIESAARCNPDRDVFVLFPSQVGFSHSLSSPVMKSLRSYRNIHFRRVNFRHYSMGTPAEQFFQTDKIFKSRHFIETFSDLLRYSTLYQFGGIYLDTDTVTQQCFNDLPANFAGNQDASIANGVLGFRSGGHKILKILMKDVCNNFDPNMWGSTGPQAITRTLQKVCNVTKIGDMKPEICSDFNVLPRSFFYPIHYSSWKSYFDVNLTNVALDITKNSVVIHVWNKLSKQQTILKDFKNETLVKMYGEKMKRKIEHPFGETAYGLIAKKNCPRAYSSSGDLF
ncbi:lactosylceramide 4-alpha-galactosyltransferase-like isoform X2 [Sitodiplosis mosellana]|uniref:lactosylceramide 4-alpha-galactosyltransferase-like isoform X2 n=1 Tax=Sitodiplosis mosellana TaxID=263140 RepID=UPI00244435F5|nr:lactosylceramide 4-alpha-galactosyltransferase-like isoform X2 [Sitodiplosis mosellana]